MPKNKKKLLFITLVVSVLGSLLLIDKRHLVPRFTVDHLRSIQNDYNHSR